MKNFLRLTKVVPQARGSQGGNRVRSLKLIVKINPEGVVRNNKTETKKPKENHQKSSLSLIVRK